MQTKNRFLIYVFYDFQGYVENYVRFMLKELNKYYKKIVIIVNGEIHEDGFLFFRSISDQIVTRSNYGYDGGAYKDAILNYLKNENWKSWYELTLMNDSFYGPIFPMDEVFELMDTKNVDFWGMTKLSHGIWYDGTSIPEHIQSYFITFRNSILRSEDFLAFWKGYKSINDFNKTVCDFEVYLTDFFSERKYSYTTYTELKGTIPNQDETKNTWMDYAYECLKYCRMPFIKKKAFTVTNYGNAIKALDYIKNESEYDTQYIDEHIKRLDKNKQLIGRGIPYSFFELEHFFETHSRVFLYGNGNMKDCLKDYFDLTGKKIEGVIVSDKQNEATYTLDEIYLKSNDGIIISVGSKYADEIYEILKKNKIDDKNIIRPIF
ncbi:rhamnan synthesis F family protein [Lachnospiraceae bacterium C1.1]|nr:rhamnan synthesis F family protein [Lachnospiraceae bacterium C1.1]